ncbi:MAG: 1-acyl-sn-glycerol-3-phosphate acyltransferase [Proteobacteria bacterium]|nr:1-acyl-sn-glycerol-3-phosphate acyltransferase [Pseudomonadota bacterium]MBU1711080.1 1-acyl-sn-glycerol-3-phosphate acyltransferase [Pseudomonadota bacterium]
MNILNFPRALLVLILTPLLTFLVSVTTIIYAVIFRATAQTIQTLPRNMGRIVTWLSGVDVTIEGEEKLDPQKPYIFAANHQSQFDIFTLQGHLKHDFRWLAKKELFDVPVFGIAMRYGGYVSIDRSRGRAAMKSLAEAAQRIADGTSVIIFPEGTRSKDGKLQPFKSGGMTLAIKSGVQLVPVAIIGTHEILPKGRLLVKPGKVLVRVGEPMETGNYSLKERQELAEKLHDKVAKLLQD